MTTTEEKDQIHRQMTIQEVLSLFPQKAQRLAKEITNAGLHCVGCHAATWETVEAGMRGHGFSEESIDRLIARLNGILSEDMHADPKSVTLTPKAAEKFIEFAKAEGKQGYGLRFSDRMEGCSGFTYELDFAEKPTENDSVFQSHGIDIFVDKSRLGRLLGAVIDFVETLSSTGFSIYNPNAASSCGCGSSHNYSKENSEPSQSSGGCCSKEKDSSERPSSGGGCCSKEQEPASKSQGGGCCSR